MFTRFCVGLFGFLLLLTYESAATAGMPAPLPTNVDKVLRLNAPALERLQAISFFILAFLLSAGVIQLLWNYLRHDFASMPRLSYGKALAATFLWGLLFVIVLTMISGARELMTPGAWTKQGFTYKLVDDSKVDLLSETHRREHVGKLRTALLQFAATHQGRYPAANEISAIASDLWEIPGSAGMRYVYVSGQSANHLPEILAYEPEIMSGKRLVLRTNGDILAMSSIEIRSALDREKKP